LTRDSAGAATRFAMDSSLMCMISVSRKVNDQWPASANEKAQTKTGRRKRTVFAIGRRQTLKSKASPNFIIQAAIKTKLLQELL